MQLRQNLPITTRLWHDADHSRHFEATSEDRRIERNFSVCRFAGQ
jgi:hypothetical protein